MSTKKPSQTQAIVLNAGLDHPDSFYMPSHGTYRLRIEPYALVSRVVLDILTANKWVSREPASDGSAGGEPKVNPDPKAKGGWHETLGWRWYVTAAGAAAVGREQNPAILAEMERRYALRAKREADRERAAKKTKEKYDRAEQIREAAPAMLAALEVAKLVLVAQPAIHRDAATNDAVSVVRAAIAAATGSSR